ncbi:MAG: site-2 protease family protein [Candidatus Omnitrophota bacterium]
MTVIINIIITILIFSILIVVHEFGHFIAAKRSGVSVEKFAIGFGPPIFTKKVKETDFLICLFPLGGYVKLAGEERNSCRGLNHEFFSKPIGVRARIVFFGPFFNILLALISFWIVFIFIGFSSNEPVVGGVQPYGPVPAGRFTQEEIRILTQSKLLEEEGPPKKNFIWRLKDIEELSGSDLAVDNAQYNQIVKLWRGASRAVHKNLFVPGQMEVFLEYNVIEEKLLFWNVENEQKFLSGLAAGDSIDKDRMLNILRDSRFPAKISGILENDRILAVNSKPVETWDDMRELISTSKDKIKLKISRENKFLEIDVKPKIITVPDIGGERTISVIGIAGKVVKGNLFSCLRESSVKVYEISISFIRGIGSLVLHKVPFKEAVAGPIGIGVLTAHVAKGGLIALLNFTGILSLSLAIINLFPFPVLDGGHLLFMALEKIRKKPLSAERENMMTQTGMAILIFLMLFVSLNDISKHNFIGARKKQNLVRMLAEKGFLRKLDNEGHYAFWNAKTEKDLTARLSRIPGIKNKSEIISLWKESPRVTTILPK